MSDRAVEYRARIGELEATIVSECDQKYLLVAEINDLKGRIETLEAALQESIDDWRERNMDAVFLSNVNAAHELATEITKNKQLAARIETLEAALRAIAEVCRTTTPNKTVLTTIRDCATAALNQQPARD